MTVPEEVVRRAAGVRLVVLDVDGVLTDGMIAYTRDGETLKRFHAHDGLGVRLLMHAGVEVALVTGRGSEPLERWAREAKITHFHPNAGTKLATVTRLAEKLGIGLDEVCFAGDDLLDLPAMRAVGFAVSVPNGHPAVRAAAHWITPRMGGAGAVRDLVDVILDARLGLSQAYERYLASLAETAEPGFGVIIPARYGATRLPGKPLRDLGGRPLVLHVLANAKRAGAAFVTVATDDARIAQVVEEAGGKALLTSAEHPTGTDRLAEAVDRLGLKDDAVVVNLQGDEPFAGPALVRRVAHMLLKDPTAQVATLATPIHHKAAVVDPHVVKVIVNDAGVAMTFSRAPIPWLRDAPLYEASGIPEHPKFLRHVGIYAYRVRALRKIAAQPQVPLEQAEALEQLRILWLGIPIHIAVVEEAPANGVDTEIDLWSANERFLGANVRPVLDESPQPGAE